MQASESGNKKGKKRKAILDSSNDDEKKRRLLEQEKVTATKFFSKFPDCKICIDQPVQKSK